MSLFKRKKEKINGLALPAGPDGTVRAGGSPPKQIAVSEKTAVTAPPKNIGNLHKVTDVIWSMRVTEKSSVAAGENKYIFIVSPKANKRQIKHDINAKFGVNVINVNVVNLPAKERRRGTIIGWKPGIKKAIVKLKEGEKIEIQ